MQTIKDSGIIGKYFPTTDDFGGNFANDTVEVEVLDNRNYLPRPFVRVWVGGNDDFALVADFDDNLETMLAEATQLYESISLPITIDGLKKLGFSYF